MSIRVIVNASRLGMIVLLLLSLALPGPGQAIADTSDGITFGYWNDNILFQRQLNSLFGKGAFTGQDDFQTANFWTRISSIRGHDVHHLDFYLNVVTSKAQQVRFDLFTARWMSEIRHEAWEGRYGIGIMSTGNFGGESVQNLYHSSTGESTIRLPYYPTFLVHLAFYGSVRAHIISVADLTASSIVSASLLTGSGPAYAEGGGSLAYHPKDFPEFRARAHAGFVSFYQAPALYAPMFGTGFMSGTMISVNAFSRSWISLWYTYNQYGKQQKHFGISYSTQPVHIIDDIRFP